MLTVADDGPGAPEESIESLTAPFARSGDVLTRGTRGIGLGLTFVDHAVRAHGGHLQLSTAAGFSVTLRVPVDPAGSDAPPSPSRGEHTRRPSVLVVEDDPSLRALAELTLIDAGCAVVAVGNGRDAVQIATGDPPDVIVLDVQLPGLDGREAARLLREDPATAGVPIVVVTGSADRRELWSIWASGADALLTKPYDVTELAGTVLELAAVGGGGGVDETTGDPLGTGTTASDDTESAADPHTTRGSA